MRQKNRPFVLIILCTAILVVLSGCSESSDYNAPAQQEAFENLSDAATIETATKETVDTVPEAAAEAPSEEKSFREDNNFVEEYGSFTVTSQSLHDGVWDDVISNTDAGANKSPQLSWEPVEGAELYLVYMADLGAWNWIHWKSADVMETDLDEGWADSSDYKGPYPPPGSTHTYEVYVVALKKPIERMKGAFDAQNPRFEENFRAADTDIDGNKGNILGVGRISGTFTHK
ncbi:MAG: hypothetical protein K6E90_01530 [Lachnospiraceae bacterium]|nr:hypothetical protein [Lachnospiraceae bacterium]